MIIKIAICDDTPEDIVLLTEALYAYDPAFDISAYTDGETLIDEIQNSKLLADILFLDIYLPGMDGVMVSRSIRTARNDIKIIFVSSSQDHYPESYEVFAFNYILKPFQREKLYGVMDRALEEIRKEHLHKIQISYKSKVYNVDCRDIRYIESQDKLILFHMADAGILQCYGKLDDIAKELPQQSFIRCHKSFTVNASHIKEMGENYFRIGQTIIGISKRHLKTAKDQYYMHLFSQMGRGKLG